MLGEVMSRPWLFQVSSPNDATAHGAQDVPCFHPMISLAKSNTLFLSQGQ